MTIADRVSSLLRRKPLPAPEVKTTETERPPRPETVTELSYRLRGERERLALIDRCNEMYDTDPRAEAVIDTLARDIVQNGFTLQCAANPRVVEIGSALVQRLKLFNVLDDWLRETFIDGDSFFESGVSDAMQIEEVTRKPVLGMNRFTDRLDHFVDPARAFWYSDTLYSLNIDAPPRDALWFPQWQIIHARWKKRTSKRYGRPLFASAVGAWKRVTEGELNMSVRRMTRSGLRYHHHVEGDATAIEEYKRVNRTALDNPLAAIADFYSNTANGITVVQGDAHLQEIADVVHHLETWWTASPVPMVLVGYGKDLNRDVLEQKQDQYRNALSQITLWAEMEIVRPLLDLELLLNGVLPAGSPYDLVWKAKTETTAADLDKVADAILKLKGLGVPDDLLWAIVARYLPWLDVQAVLEAADQEAPIQTDQEAQRIAQDLNQEEGGAA